jgi:hypothetical protein
MVNHPNRNKKCSICKRTQEELAKIGISLVVVSGSEQRWKKGRPFRTPFKKRLCRICECDMAGDGATITEVKELAV